MRALSYQRIPFPKPTKQILRANFRDTRKPLVLNMSPIYLSDDCRTYGNPLSYLGGPRLQPRNRNSIESVLSLD
ncbi:hypothetical protein HZH68_007253 [Vespula germanica]|uniref:Uncharacterized protein n=1 Tax=Vespula germanica TaxID=30212 RepID=A0A834NBK2_VESGE|nr:hypothetical protein HZH68_007253 [Vespula germanica]